MLSNQFFYSDKDYSLGGYFHFADFKNVMDLTPQKGLLTVNKDNFESSQSDEFHLASFKIIHK